MEHQNLLNLLNEARSPKIVTRKWNIVNDQSNTNYDIENEIIYNTEVLKSNLCDYNDAYILVRGDITLIEYNGIQVAFKIVHHSLNVSQKFMDQKQMMLET